MAFHDLVCKSYIWISSLFLVSTHPILAQIIPDTTLPNNSQVESQEEIDRITEGTTQGNNLFHSFSQFSVLNGRTAYFDNSLTIDNIFTRVTGDSISNIDGIIKANGTANLFLINPSGIIFTENASLNIGGSFIGSTANSIKFSDGREFSATNPKSKPLLSVNLPTALQFTTIPSAIEVQGKGHIKEIDGITLETLEVIAEQSLAVNDGQTLALIGGEISLNGGSLQAEDGRIELGSLQQEGDVTIDRVSNGWTFGYQNIDNFQNIILDQATLVNTTGNLRSGDIHLQGKTISLQNGSELVANNQGEENGGQVLINASESVELNGISEDRLFVIYKNPDDFKIRELSSSITAEVNKIGKGSDVLIKTKELLLENGAQVSSGTFAKGNAANITINAQSIVITDENENPLFFPAGLFSQTNSTGNGGILRINTDNLTVKDGSEISATSFNEGKGGDVLINAKQINLDSTSGIFVNSEESIGDGGDAIINTGKLILEDGAQIGTITFDEGKGGTITISASESIELKGKTEFNATGLFANAITGNGKGGSITIKTNNLLVEDGALINVSNLPSSDTETIGTGEPGNINIIANNLNIDNGQITAIANLENGGNINLNVSGISTLSNQAVISATAGVGEQFGNGGNINFNSQFIVGSNSQITAEAFKGIGGNINLNAEGLFFAPDMIISASSQLGANGELNVKIPDTQPIQGLIERQNLEYPEQIAIGCSDDAYIEQGSFTYREKGGIPASGTDNFEGDTVLEDIRPLSNTTEENIKVIIPPEKLISQPIKEARGWRWKNENKDKVIFTTNTTEVNPQNSSSSKINCNLLSEN